MKAVETIEHEGVLLFKDTVVGMFLENDKLITVGSLTVEWKEASERKQRRIEEVCDCLRILLDECKEERLNSRFTNELVRAMEQAEIVLSVPKYDTPLEEQPYYKGHTAGQHWRDDKAGREVPVNPYELGTIGSQEWKTGFHDGYTSTPTPPPAA